MNGVVILNKPADFTSFDAVAKLRRIFHTRKIGHTGTLDPMATGVLPICIGSATAAVDMLTAENKTYVAGVKLGFRTDTLDTTGTVTATAPIPSITRELLEEAFSHFLGEIDQMPPMYSAIKQNGKKLYELARKGIEVERPTRRVCVHGIRLLSFDDESFSFEVSCSKGLYVRSLIDDIGVRLGTFAVMSSLVRTQTGSFSIDRAVTIQALEQAEQDGTLASFLIPTDTLFSYPKLVLSEKQATRVKNGVPIYYSGTEGDTFRVYDPSGAFLCISRLTVIDEKLCLKSVKNFYSKEI